MRRLLIAAVVLAAACAGPASSRRSRLAFSAPPEVKDPNFVLVVAEVVPDPSGDGATYTKVFVDGREAGRTAIGRRSEERRLGLKLPPGNQPIRLEHWVLPSVGEWTRLDDSQQPRERFVKIEDGTIARLELRFAEGEAANSLTLTRAPAGQ